VAFVALAALAAALPFERTAPIVSVGPVGVTTTEACLYAAMLLWGVSRALGSSGSWTPAHAAALAVAAATLVSAVGALHERGAALKFALRSVSGIALFFAVADQVATRARAVRLALALSAGAVVAALATIAEAVLPGIAPGLLAFKPAAFEMQGALRPSGTLAYPTITAMYLEGALPILVALGGGAGRGGRAAAGAAVWVASGAIVLTGSRAGILVALLTLVGMAAADVGGRLGLRGLAASGAAGLSLIAAATWAQRPDMAARLGLRGDGAWYRADFDPDVKSLSLRAGESSSVSVRLRNRGAVDWSARGPASVYVSYEWRDPRGALVLESPQFQLQRDVHFGEEATVVLPVRAPVRPGTYRLRWQLGSRGVTWGDAAAGGDVQAEIAPGTGEAAAPEAVAAPRPIQKQLTRLELWRSGFRIWRESPLLGAGPDNFRRLYPRTLGPHPLDERIRANSLYVETLSDTGILGVAALAALIVAVGAVARRRWRGAQPAVRRMLLGAAAGFGAFLLHGIVDDFLAFTPTLGLFWLLAGILAARAGEGPGFGFGFGTISLHTTEEG
jgi:hypothetical protein